MTGTSYRFEVRAGTNVGTFSLWVFVNNGTIGLMIADNIIV